MRRLVLSAVAVLLAGAVGCGDGRPPLNTAPLTDEEKQKIKEQDKMIDDEERSGSGTATPAKKKKK
jgi:hypothetical protein